MFRIDHFDSISNVNSGSKSKTHVWKIGKLLLECSQVSIETASWQRGVVSSHGFGFLVLGKLLVDKLEQCRQRYFVGLTQGERTPLSRTTHSINIWVFGLICFSCAKILSEFAIPNRQCHLQNGISRSLDTSVPRPPPSSQGLPDQAGLKPHFLLP